jgi:uncharacterized protein (DUF488 family)
MLKTIGYERSSLADFVATLKLHGVEVLCDIRDRAQSRVAGFSKTPLAEALESVGIEYLHFRELGDPKDGRDAARAGQYEKFREVYQSVLANADAKNALSAIGGIASKKSVCLMCYERDEKHCHRKIVSDRLHAVFGIKATHIGVRKGQGGVGEARRVLHSGQGTATSIQQVF